MRSIEGISIFQCPRSYSYPGLAVVLALAFDFDLSVILSEAKDPYAARIIPAVSSFSTSAVGCLNYLVTAPEI
jgi:hypothetical protein